MNLVRNAGAGTIRAEADIVHRGRTTMVIEVKVRRNLKRMFGRLFGWTLAAVAGGALSTFGETGINAAKTYVEKFLLH